MMDEWGPWIEHDGKGCPPKGTFVEKEYINGLFLAGFVGGPVRSSTGLGISRYIGQTFSSSWFWVGAGSCVPIIRYRIRRPRGMEVLDAILADMPEQVDA